MIFDLSILSSIIWLPIIAGFALLMLPKQQELLAKTFSMLIAVVCTGLAIKLVFDYDTANPSMQFVERYTWLPILNIEYYLGADGFSIPLVLLTCFMTIIVVMASSSVKSNVVYYLSAFLIMQGIMCGVFLALDIILFYVFFEAMLIPMFLIIGYWGGKNRVYATIKFFLYTFFGSVFFLISILYLHNIAKELNIQDSFSILTLQRLEVSLEVQKWIFWGLLLGFAVKVPMWPVHTWLPDAHTEAPTGGSVILAAITLKIGGYGLLRFILPMVPDASLYFAPIMIALSLIAICYIGLVAIVQQDLKKLIAYSSIAHMGFVTLGVFAIFKVSAANSSAISFTTGIEGAMVQMISHGFVSAGLFLCVGVLYDRMHTRLINDFGGVANTMPIFAAFFMLFALANCGLPGTSGFVGEFLVILTAAKASIWYAALAGLTLIFAAAYSLWMYKRVMFGIVANSNVANMEDLTVNEMLMLAILAFAVLILGLWPAPVLDLIHISSLELINTVMHSN